VPCPVPRRWALGTSTAAPNQGAMDRRRSWGTAKLPTAPGTTLRVAPTCPQPMTADRVIFNHSEEMRAAADISILETRGHLYLAPAVRVGPK
jgi:hypothetical protein